MDFEIAPLTNFEELKSLDFTENGSDPLGVHDFAQTKAPSYNQNKLSTVWGVSRKGKVVGFFAVSMFSIQTKKLETTEHVSEALMISYPAVLLGQMGVDKKHRGQGIGKTIVNFCIGLAQEASHRIACRYVVLQTNQNKTTLYHKLQFIQSTKPNVDGKVWMYRRVA